MVKHVETDGLRAEVHARLLAVRRECALEQFRSSRFRRIVDAETWAKRSVGHHEVDSALEQAASRAEVAWKLVAMLESLGDDAAPVRTTAAWWTSIAERWAARGGPEHHAEMLRRQANMIRQHISKVGHTFSEASRAVWMEVALDKEMRAESIVPIVAEAAE